MPILESSSGARHCAESVDCSRLEAYESVPAIMREALGRFGIMPIHGLKGVY